MNILIRSMVPTDWSKVADIYKQGIETGNATFQQFIPTWEEWNTAHVQKCRIVAEVDNEIVGWAALSSVSARAVYSGVAEVSLYVASMHRGQHIGTTLLESIIAESELHGFWTLQSGIFPENTASIAIHKKSGFREIGYREKMANMNNVWRNTVLFERRSAVTGVE